MKSEVFVIVALIVALMIVVEAIAYLAIGIVRYCWLKWKFRCAIEKRRERFYSELGMLMKDRATCVPPRSANA